MSALAAQQEHYKAVRARLMRPAKKWPAPVLVEKTPEHIDPIDIQARYHEVFTPQTPNYTPPMKKFIQEFASKTPFTYEELIGPSHNRGITAARHDLIYAMKREFPLASLPEIGKAVRKDHSTVCYALKKRGYYAEREISRAA